MKKKVSQKNNARLKEFEIKERRRCFVTLSATKKRKREYNRISEKI